jgi:hypothetical protein
VPQPRDSAWDEILQILREEPDDAQELLHLAELLARHGRRAPVFGYELGTGHWLADFGWPADGVKIAVTDHGTGEDEATRRDKAFTDVGWTVRTAAQWLDKVEELVERLPATEGTRP